MAEIASAWVSLLPSAVDFGSATEKAIGPQMNSAGKSAGGILGKAIGVAAGAAILAAGLGKGLYEIGQTFDDMNDTIVVGTGASGRALAGLENVAKSIGKTTPSSFADIGTAVAGLNQRLDLTGKPLQDMATRVLNLSRITKTDLSTNIADMSRVFGDWGISMKDQPAALDKIFFASQKTGTSINSLAQSVVQMGAPLRQFGFSFEESLAMFGKWEKEGVNTTAVMSGLKIGLGKFSKAGLAPKQALEDVQKAIMGAGSAGEANKLAIEAFGQRAGPDMAAAVREGRFALGDLVKGINGSGGAINKADKGTRDFAETWQVFKNNVLLKLEPIATRVFSGFSDFAAQNLPSLISGFDRVSAAVGSFAADFRNGVGVAGQLSGALSTLGGVLMSVGNFILNNKAAVATFAGIILTVVAAVKVWTIAQIALNLAMAMNPIGLVVIAIAALAAGLVMAYQKSETFRAVVDGVFSFLKTAVAFTVGFVKDHWQLIVSIIGGPLVAIGILVVKHWSAIKSFVMGAVNAVINFVRDHWRLIITIIGGPLGLAVALVTKYWGQIKSATSAVWGAIKAVVSAQVGAIKAAIGGIADLVGKVRGWFQEIVDAIKNKLKAAVDRVAEFPGDAARALGDLGNTLYSYGRNLIQGFINGIKDKAGEIVGAVTGPISSAVSGVKGLLHIGSPSKLFHQIGKWTMEGFKNGIDEAGPDVLKAMQSALEKTLDKVSAFRDGIASRLDSVKSSFSSLKDSIASTFSGDLFNVSAIASSLTDTTFTAAQTVGQAFVNGLADTKSNLQGLLKAFKTLKGWGIPAQFLSQLFASGNSGLILELASGTRGQAASAASLFGDVQSLSNQLGTQVARNQYGADLRDIRGELKRANDHLKHLDNLEHKLARALSGAVSHGQKKGAAG